MHLLSCDQRINFYSQYSPSNDLSLRPLFNAKQWIPVNLQFAQKWWWNWLFNFLSSSSCLFNKRLALNEKRLTSCDKKGNAILKLFVFKDLQLLLPHAISEFVFFIFFVKKSFANSHALVVCFYAQASLFCWPKQRIFYYISD